jgi:hypothetical protein
MDGFSIIVPDGPLITVHKGWLPTRKKPLETPSPNIGKATSPVKGPVVKGSTAKSNGNARHFEFVNAVEPGRSKDPAVRKYVFFKY